jgi:threonine/homoserine/homoserine lactone efflux protein
VLRALEVVGGGFLLWLAVDAFRSAHIGQAVADARPSLPPALRGVLAVALNPAGWLFLGVVAAPLFASATRTGGTGAAVVTAITLVMGIALGDGTVVLLGGLGIRRADDRLRVWVRRVLAIILAALAVSIVASGVFGQVAATG